MQKAYNRINWENYPSDRTPINETNLNKLDVGVNEIDNRIISLDSTKLDKTEASQLVKNITLDEATGIFTITYLSGATATIDTMLEKVVVNFDYDETNQKLVFTLDDGTVKEVDLKALITEYEFEATDTVAFFVDTNGKISANVKDGSIQEQHLRPNYLADIRVESAKAESSAVASDASAIASENSAVRAESWTVGGTGTRTDEDTDNAKYYYEASKQIYNDFENVGAVVGVKGDAETDYRAGLVNITAENIGAVATSKVLDTAELISANTVGGNVAGALGVKQIKNALNDSINTLNTNLQNTIYSNGGTIEEKAKWLIENKKLPTNKPFMVKEAHSGNNIFVGHIYDSWNYGGFLVITIGEVYYAKVSNGTLASLTKIGDYAELANRATNDSNGRNISTGYMKHYDGYVSKFNDMLTRGKYLVNGTYKASEGAPWDGALYGALYVFLCDDTRTHNNTSTWLMQLLFDTYGNIKIRRKINADEWSSWNTLTNNNQILNTAAAIEASTSSDNIVGVQGLKEYVGKNSYMLSPKNVTAGNYINISVENYTAYLCVVVVVPSNSERAKLEYSKNSDGKWFLRNKETNADSDSMVNTPTLHFTTEIRFTVSSDVIYAIESAF